MARQTKISSRQTRAALDVATVAISQCSHGERLLVMSVIVHSSNNSLDVRRIQTKLTVESAQRPHARYGSMLRASG